MPFCMKTAPGIFQCTMSDVALKGLNFADAYINDIEVDTAQKF